MIRNILTRIFSPSEPPVSSNPEPVSITNKSIGISGIPDSFESSPAKTSLGFNVDVLPSKQDLQDATKKQEDLLKEKHKLSEEQKKLEEAIKEAANNGDNGSFLGGIGSLFGDDKGAIDYQTQNALNTYNEAEKCSQHIAETVDDTSDDVKKHFGG